MKVLLTVLTAAIIALSVSLAFLGNFTYEMSLQLKESTRASEVRDAQLEGSIMLIGTTVEQWSQAVVREINRQARVDMDIIVGHCTFEQMLCEGMKKFHPELEDCKNAANECFKRFKIKVKKK